MQKRWLINLILAGVICLLVLVVLYKPGHRDTLPQPLLAGVDIDAIDHIRLEKVWGKPVLLKKDKESSKWALLEPFFARTNQFELNGLLKIFQAEVDPQFEAEGTLEKYGLKEPDVTMHLGDEITIAFGTRHPLGEKYYVLYNGRIQLIDEHFYRRASQNYTSFVDKSMFEQDERPIAFDLPDLKFKLVDGIWQDESKEKPYDPDQMSAFADEWRYAQALSVKPSFEKPTLDKAIVSVQSEGADAKARQIEFNVISYKPDFILLKDEEKMEYRFPAEMADRLMKIRR